MENTLVYLSEQYNAAMVLYRIEMMNKLIHTVHSLFLF